MCSRPIRDKRCTGRRRKRSLWIASSSDWFAADNCGPSGSFLETHTTTRIRLWQSTRHSSLPHSAAVGSSPATRRYPRSPVGIQLSRCLWRSCALLSILLALSNKTSGQTPPGNPQCTAASGDTIKTTHTTREEFRSMETLLLISDGFNCYAAPVIA